MSFNDRRYNGDNNNSGFSAGGGSCGMAGGMSFPKPTNFVKYLLIINFVLYVLQIIFDVDRTMSNPFAQSFIDNYFTVKHNRPFDLWRLVTFQFLHGSPMHLLFNMIGLYFLGTMIERTWGGIRFLKFYLTCGIVGGVLYILFANIGLITPGLSLLGASGGVLGLLMACAIMYPGVTVIMILFPVPIRIATALLTVVYALSVLGDASNAGGDMCHLGGMATAFVWIKWRSLMGNVLEKQQQSSYRRKIKQDQDLQYEVDKILAKVHAHGLQSLSNKEKQILQKATDKQHRPDYR